MKQMNKMCDINNIVDRGFILKSECSSIMTGDTYIKVSLVDKEGETEGIWASLLTLEGRGLYEDDSSIGDIFYAVLANDALAFYPNRSWGMVIMVKTNGNERPIAYVNENEAKLKSVYSLYLEEYKNND